MLESFFIWGFIVLPLVSAILLMLYRARYFLFGVFGMALAVGMVWGIVSIGQGLSRWLDDPPGAEDVPDCAEGQAPDGSCGL